jgi:hypothetical protein
MDIIKIILQEYEYIGGGEYGTAYKKTHKVYDKDKIVDKDRAHKITKDVREGKFAEAIFKNQDKLTSFPKIYKVIKNEKNNKYIIERELIKTIKNGTEKAYMDAYVFKIRNYINDGTMEDFEKIKAARFSDKFINFLINLREDFKKLNIDHYVDIHSGNIGINEKGDYVLFDF